MAEFVAYLAFPRRLVFRDVGPTTCLCGVIGWPAFGRWLTRAGGFLVAATGPATVARCCSDPRVHRR